MPTFNKQLFLGVTGLLLLVYFGKTIDASDAENSHDNDKTTSNTLDLRGLTVDVAREEVEKFLKSKHNDYHSRGKRKIDRFVHINTGWGKAGSKASSIIFEVIDAYLTKNGFNFKWINVGDAKIDLFYSK